MVASRASEWAAAGLPSPGESSSTASYRSTLAQRVGTTLDSLSTAHARSTDLLDDAALSDAAERIWDGLARPEAGATWRQVTLDVVLEAAALQRVRRRILGAETETRSAMRMPSGADDYSMRSI